MRKCRRGIILLLSQNSCDLNAMNTLVENISVISPKEEMGAFEALWSNGISSFKQLRAKLTETSACCLSELVNKQDTERFYLEAIHKLHECGVQRFGVRIDGTVDYPKQLHDADYPLALLYYQGKWDFISNRGVAVVGTRKPSLEGQTRARKLVEMLVGRGFTIYSGLAAGIDTIAHRTAIDMGGRTVAVIGTPLSRNYPKENSELQKLIAEQYLLISQVPICRYEQNGPSFNRMFFPERNITMSALSEATIIVEAGETSGTLIQARAALKQGRKLFILNNCFEDRNLKWPQKYEKMGAIRVRSIEDIEKELSSHE